MPTVVQAYRRFVGRRALLRVLFATARIEEAVDGTQLLRTREKPGLNIPIMILNARMRFGVTELLVKPHRGLGSRWVRWSPERITLVEDWPPDTDAIALMETEEIANAETSKARGAEEDITASILASPPDTYDGCRGPGVLETALRHHDQPPDSEQVDS